MLESLGFMRHFVSCVGGEKVLIVFSACKDQLLAQFVQKGGNNFGVQLRLFCGMGEESRKSCGKRKLFHPRWMTAQIVHTTANCEG